MYDRVRAIADGLCWLLEVLCNVMLAVMTAVIATLVLSRNVLAYSPPWSEEITRYLLVWLTMLGAAVLLRRDDHIRLDLLNQTFPLRVQIILSLFLRLLVLAFLVILARQGWVTALARNATRAPASGLSLFWPYLALPVGGGIMIFVTLVNVWGDMLELLGRRSARTAV